MKRYTKIASLTCLALISVLTVSSCTKKKPQLPDSLSASQYLDLASQAAPQDQPMYKLAAANKYIEQQKPEQARQVLNGIASDTSPEQDVEKQLLEAKVALLDGQAQLALNTLNQIQGNNVVLSNAQQIMLHQLLANTYEAIGNTMQSIDQRSALQPLLNDPQAARMNLISIWHSLQTLSTAQLNSAAVNANTPLLKGWISLALIIKQSKTPNELIQSLRDWKAQYPSHPAIGLLPQNIEQEINQTSKLKNMALLLPLSGQLRTTGEAIRNGFLAAYYSAEKHSINMPHLKIYNTANQDINSVYKQAVQDGANLVVGPLLKENVQKLLNSDTISVPTLALNTLADAPQSNKNLFQFGLSPLDEAQQAADRAWKQGDKNAVIISTNSNWGQDIAKVFTQTWENLGGNVIAQAQVSASDNLANQIGQLLQINLANQNYTDLRRLLHTNIRFLPRRRKDIDVIYLIAQPSDAQQIAPLLKYYYAGDIPIYAISQIYNGAPNIKADHDLNGIYFCDMPWVLTPGAESQDLKQLRQQIETIWPLSYSRNRKLYALGIDSFKLAIKLEQMQALPQFAINGATGELYLDQAQHIYRRLLWAQFKNGSPAVLN